MSSTAPTASAPITSTSGAVIAEVRYYGDRRLIVFADGRGRWAPDSTTFEAITWYARCQVERDPSLGSPRRVASSGTAAA